MRTTTFSDDSGQPFTQPWGPRHGRLARSRSLDRPFSFRPLAPLGSAHSRQRRRQRRRDGGKSSTSRATRRHARSSADHDDAPVTLVGRPAHRSPPHALSYRHHRGELGARSLCPMEIRTSTVRHIRGNTCWATARIKRATARQHHEPFQGRMTRTQNREFILGALEKKIFRSTANALKRVVYIFLFSHCFSMLL